MSFNTVNEELQLNKRAKSKYILNFLPHVPSSVTLSADTLQQCIIAYHVPYINERRSKYCPTSADNPS